MTCALIAPFGIDTHRTPPGHPERPERLAAVLSALDETFFPDLQRFEAPKGDREFLRTVHDPDHLDRLDSLTPGSGAVAIDTDTVLLPDTLDAALRGVGGACLGVDLVLEGRARNAFIASRPPGHHAERARAMGFCFYGTVAAAALHAVRNRGIERVAVLDFDAHHGNGTQDILWDASEVFFASTHQRNIFPMRGTAEETGAHGQILNLPLKNGSGSRQMAEAWGSILARVEEWRPELILLSAGFDAHQHDPLAGLRWRDTDFTWLTGRILDLAERHAPGRVVSVLEGGYDLGVLRRCVPAHMRLLAGPAPERHPEPA
ncbi:histone deacetylase family protein [Defluviimonas salinarum]|uniref:Histone deacetylase family protein n=1 Tax=Defluviimonas salinarum TaxID=2992147 RepID=A0ABT3J483_9RHOB|nr:histone deacetylase family protein [Defluviimonas salinarum]MCW3782489.1 histone deacetylase family protein [Defluviimonas salinarum]